MNSEVENIFREIIRHVGQAVSISDPDSNRVLYLSPVHEQIWGRPLDELYERSDHWVDSIHPADRDRILGAAAEASETGIYDEQYRIVRPSGEVRWIRDRAFPIHDGKQAGHKIAGIVEDITDWKIASEQLEMRVRERTEELAWANLALESEISERRRAEIQLSETNKRLQKAVAELVATQQQIIRLESQRALGKMAGGIAHDFDNALIFEPVDLVAALREAVSTTEPAWRDAALADGRQIKVKQEYQTVPLIACHGADIREAATNLLFNAVDALPEGGRIIVRAYPEEQEAVLEIQDNGIGMTEDVRARCLEPSFTTKGRQAAGLGLAIVYGIVQRHYGNIQIESKVGEGSLIRVRLPFAGQRCFNAGSE
jgi:two-component system cell cycle sensor histidine kinase/response regulator CckA